MNADYWLDRAVEKIRFTPDRKAVRRELAAHLEDRREKFEAQGLGGYEAEKAATEAMGDPAEIAEELARVHTPYWGWLWKASRWALGLVLFFSFFTLLPSVYDSVRNRSEDAGVRPGPPAQAGETTSYVSGVERTILENWHPRGSKKCGNYRFSVPDVWMERWESPPEEDWEYFQLVIRIRADTWRFWELSEPYGNFIIENKITDSGGRWYFGGGICFEYPVNIAAYGDHALYADLWLCRAWSGTFFTCYQIGLHRADGEDVPDWIDVPIGYGGSSIRIDLRNEVVS